MTEILEECTKFLSYSLLLAPLPSLSNSDPQMFQDYGWVVGMKLLFESFIKTFNFTCDIWMAVTVMMVAWVFIVWLSVFHCAVGLRFIIYSELYNLDTPKANDTAFCGSEHTLSPGPERQGKRISWKVGGKLLWLQYCC